MGENKYYVPEIDEFYIGFEFEWFDNDDKDWNNAIIKYQSELANWTAYEDIHKRVKYLDKQDLIELGFEEDSFWSRESVDNPDKSYSMNNNRHIVFRHEFNKGKYCIYDYSRKINDQRLFEGYIKNKSELIKVLKMLGIK